VNLRSCCLPHVIQRMIDSNIYNSNITILVDIKIATIIVGMYMAKKVAFNTRVSDVLLNEFRALAVLLDKSLNDFFEEAMLDLIKKYDQDNLIVELRKLKAKAQKRR